MNGYDMDNMWVGTNFQAECCCGWRGPSRKSNGDAVDDAHEHSDATGHEVAVQEE